MGLDKANDDPLGREFFELSLKRKIFEYPILVWIYLIFDRILYCF